MEPVFAHIKHNTNFRRFIHRGLDKVDQKRRFTTYNKFILMTELKKDRYNRKKGTIKLEKQIRGGKLTKSNINNRGYNKFLKLEGEISVAIDYDKLKHDSRWDVLKGYLTNAKMNKNQVIENYQHLWQIVNAFRVSKSDPKVRPIYHRLQRRIEAHICISFVAYKIHKELDRQLKKRKAKISANTAIEIAKTILQHYCNHARRNGIRTPPYYKTRGKNN